MGRDGVWGGVEMADRMGYRWVMGWGRDRGWCGVEARECNGVEVGDGMGKKWRMGWVGAEMEDGVAKGQR